MIQLSDRVLEMEESATLAMSRKSRELRAQGERHYFIKFG